MTAKQKVGWKVVRWDGTSCITYDTFAGRLYEKNRKVTPAKKCGPLCVFKRKHSAKEFAGKWVGARVKKCLYRPSKLSKIWDGHFSYSLYDLPPNTVLADSVTCLE